MQILLAFTLSLAVAGTAMAAERHLPKWSARIRIDGKPPVEVQVAAKDKPTARKLIVAQYGDKVVFTSGPVRLEGKSNALLGAEVYPVQV